MISKHLHPSLSLLIRAIILCSLAILPFVSISQISSATTDKIFINQPPTNPNDLDRKLINHSKNERYVALIIAIEEYKDQRIGDLQYPIEDAENLYEMISSKYSFDKKNISILKNPKREEIIDELDRLSTIINQNDNLLIFYSGQGKWESKAENGYWLPSNAHKIMKRDWISNHIIAEYVKAIQSKHTLLITNIYFGGAMLETLKIAKNTNENHNINQAKTSRKVLSCGDLFAAKKQSPFIEFLLAGLKSNESEIITSKDLFDQIKFKTLNNKSLSNPQFNAIHNTGDEGGEFVFILKEVELQQKNGQLVKHILNN